MRTQVIEGRTVLSVTWKDEEGYKDVVNLMKIGRRVRVTTNEVSHIRACLSAKPSPWNPDGDPADVSDIDKNVEVGPKLLARVIEDALIYGHAKGKVASDYAFGGDPYKLAFERAGAKLVRFTAPCGEQGYIANGEATKLVAALRSL